MLDQSHIGRELGSHRVEIEKGRLKLFNKVIGQTNPVYTDEALAKAAGYPGLPVPPTFYCSLDLEQDDPFAWFEALGIPIARILHASQDFTYHRPAYAGQTVSLNSKIADVFEKKGGTLKFIVKETEVRSETGELLVTMSQTLVVRGQQGVST